MQEDHRRAGGGSAPSCWEPLSFPLSWTATRSRRRTMAVLLAGVALIATLLGGVVALRARDRLHLVLGVAAGVLLGVAAFDLLPEALRQTTSSAFGVPVPMLAAIGGFFTVHILERSLAIHRAHGGEHGGDLHG